MTPQKSSTLTRRLARAFWIAASLWWLQASAQAETYTDVKKAAISVKSAKLKSFLTDLNDIHEKLTQASGIKTRLLLSDSEDVNAYATLGKDDEKLIVFNEGLIDLLENDRDAIAAVMAHEFAHHGKNHIENTQSSNKALGVLGAVVGGMLSYKLGIGRLGNDVGQLGAKVISRSFSRDQEREADREGLLWMVNAGYNPTGAVRAHTQLLSLGASQTASLFKTHPSSEERIQNMKKDIEQNPQAKLLASDKVIAITNLNEDDVQEQAGQPQASSAGDMATYASFMNAMQASSDFESTLKKFDMRTEDYRALATRVQTRLSEDTSGKSAQHFSRLLYENKTGTYAEWGKDIARAMQGERLKMAAPMASDLWLDIRQVKMNSNREAMKPWLSAQKISAYDFDIINRWWEIKAEEMRKQGNSSLLEQMNTQPGG